MPPNRNDLLGRWFASPDIDELFQSVDFREDGSGTVQSCGGHALCLCADFLWDFDSNGTIALRFQPTQQAHFPPYTPPEPGAVHAIRCALELGEFPLRIPALMGTVTYRRRLRFDESPLPADAAKYHAGTLFFSVVNQLDPRQFLVFYTRADASDVVPDRSPTPVG